MQSSWPSHDLAAIGLAIHFLTRPAPRKAWVCLTEPISRVGPITTASQGELLFHPLLCQCLKRSGN